MSKYFRFFPKTTHDLANEGRSVVLTNILRRFAVPSSVRDNVGVFHEYNVQSHDRPDTIANKYYGDSGYAWVVLMFNEIHDPTFEWPLFDYDFEQYLIGKYGSIATAQSTVHEYRRLLTERQVRSDGTIIPEKYVVVDSTAAVNQSTPTAKSAVDVASVSSIDVKVKGSYTLESDAPTVTVAAPTTITATATSVVDDVDGDTVASVRITHSGAGYTSIPNVTFTEAPVLGTTATGTAVMDSTGTRVVSVTITNAGSGYEVQPQVTIDDPVQGDTATATAVIETVRDVETGDGLYKRVKSVTINDGGSGYSFPPTITFSGGTLDTSAHSVTKYDWELEQNEKRRTIKILDKRYINLIKSEVKNVLRVNV